MGIKKLWLYSSWRLQRWTSSNNAPRKVSASRSAVTGRSQVWLTEKERTLIDFNKFLSSPPAPNDIHQNGTFCRRCTRTSTTDLGPGPPLPNISGLPTLCRY